MVFWCDSSDGQQLAVFEIFLFMLNLDFTV